MNELTTIYLVRHGQTKWNLQNRLQGHKNSALTQLGREQALNIKHSLNLINIDCAYVSPLQRAKDTLGVIMDETGIPQTIDDGLKEINLGPWEGKTKEETERSHPKEFYQFWNCQDEFYLQGAETYQQLQNRMVDSLKAIFEREKNKTVLVVSHWIAIKVVVAYYLNIPIVQLSTVSNIKNGGYIQLSDENGVVSVINH